MSILTPRYQSSVTDESPNKNYEVCLDEVGRGPLLGRVYTAAVVFDPAADFSNPYFQKIKDSKKFSSKKKMREVAEFIRSNCLAYSIQFVEADIIDEINILQAVYRGMHLCVGDILNQLHIIGLGTIPIEEDTLVVVDGNMFRPYCRYNEATGELREIPHVTVVKGDGTYLGIAAASIIAKVARDEYIYDLCRQFPELAERYKLDKNVGYGTREHLEGIAKYGITEFHRKSFRKK
jgi:ribonuclease HII